MAMSNQVPPGDWADMLGRSTIGGPDLTDSLLRWSAEARVDEAVRARSREQWLRRQAAEGTSFVGVLADLAERGRPVVVHSSTGRRHTAQIRAIGVDFVALSTATGVDVLIRLGAIVAVRSQPGEAPAMSGRTPQVQLHFLEAVAAVAEERARVLVGTATTDSFTGELRSVGSDVLTLRIDGDRDATAYVPLDAVLELAVVAS